MNDGISIDVDDKSLRKLLKRFDKLPKDVQNGVTKEVYRTALRIESRAKTTAPVKTGRLRASYLFAPLSKQSAKVATEVEYAPDVEFGHETRTVKVPAHIRVTKKGKSMVREHTKTQPARKGRFVLTNAAKVEFPRLVKRITALLKRVS